MKFSPLTLALLAGPAISQTTWYVDASACPSMGSGTAADPFCTIQAALAAAVDGDQVLVAPGVYIEAVALTATCVNLRSVGGPEVTSIAPGRDDGSSLSISGCSAQAFEVDGFTLEGGRAEQGGNLNVSDSRAPGPILFRDCVLADGRADLFGNGGGAHVEDSDVRFVDCALRDNLADSGWGGGLHASSSTVLLEGCDLRDNVAARGSGLYLDDCDAEVRGCLIEGNGDFYVSFSGGGLYASSGSLLLEESGVSHNITVGPGPGVVLQDCFAEILGCELSHNDDMEGFIGGGGLAVRGFGSTYVVDTRIADNLAGEGGGAYVDVPCPTCPTMFIGCVFEGNRVYSFFTERGFGGGALVRDVSKVVFRRCAFVGNLAQGNLSADISGEGGGVFGGPSVVLNHCTVVGNEAEPRPGSATPARGGGVLGAHVTNSIVFGNEPDQVAALMAHYSLVQGGWPGRGNIDAEPRFFDAAHGNFALRPDSPCIDAGYPFGRPDLDGSRADMGKVPFVDCNENGILDGLDISAGASLDLNQNGLPDECECLVYNYCEVTPHSTGTGATMNFTGTTSVSRNDLVLLAEDCPPDKNGLFFYGTGQGQVPFGDGWRCVLGTIQRLTLVNTGPQGTASRALDNGNPPQPSGQITPGSRWNFQFWFRDPAGPGGNGFNLSDGLEIVFCD